MYSSSVLVQYRSSFLQCTLDESLSPVGRTDTDTQSVVVVFLPACVHLNGDLWAYWCNKCWLLHYIYMLVTRQRSVWESLLLYTFNHKHTGCSVFLCLCWYFIGIAAVCICCSFPQTLLNKQFFIFSRNLFFFVIQRFLFEIVVRPVSLPASLT